MSTENFPEQEGKGLDSETMMQPRSAERAGVRSPLPTPTTGPAPTKPAKACNCGCGGKGKGKGRGGFPPAPKPPAVPGTPGATPPAPARESVQTQSGDGTEKTDASDKNNADTDPLTMAMESLDKLKEDLARSNADLYNLKQEYGNYVRRTKAEAPTHRENGKAEVVEALISVLDDIVAARAHGDLKDGPFAAIADKLEQTLAGRFGLERFGEKGELFDPELHDALMAQDSGEVSEPTIAQVLQPGYKMGDKVLRPTKVMVDNPA